ncbi:MAG: RES family NAD+ phosphorylase [Bacteroidota bacterium]
MQVYRITHSKWSEELSASGYPARWNSAGIFVIYCAASRALACLENVVHMGAVDLGASFVIMIINIPDDIKIPGLKSGEFPEGWKVNGESGYEICRPIGDKWARESASAVLKVPSAIVPGDSNYLINPGHPDFHRITIQSAEPFLFDTRIKGT